MSVTATETALGLAGLAEPCEAFEQVNESLRRREQLLAASAKASRLLLETPDLMPAVPAVLRLMGEAAGVDRVSLLLSRPGPEGEPYLHLVNEWTASDVIPHFADPSCCTCDERDWPDVARELRAGRSLCLSLQEAETGKSLSLEGRGTKSKAIVPIMVESGFVGVVGFDCTQQQRAIDSAELSALETAAGVIGAAMHRERLIETMRRERERAAEERMTELARANAAIRSNLERLASEPDLTSFLGHVLVEATRQLDASGGSVIVVDDASSELRVIAHVHNGVASAGDASGAAPLDRSVLTDLIGRSVEPHYLDLAREPGELWPGAPIGEAAQRSGGVLLFPLVFGGRSIGFVVLSFNRPDAAALRTSELLVALAHQVTLAIELTRLGHSAKRAAVLAERNRIGQEIHDGLAQAFTGILMQLSAVEGLTECRKRSRLTEVHARIRDLARDGLSEARRSVTTMRLDQPPRPGLELALRQLADRSSVPGRISCSFEGGGIATGLRPEQEHELLRIAQEAVSNALRHAQPRKVRICMTDGEDDWTLAIADDGCGMAEEGGSADGFGLISMRERATAIGGQWSIDSRRGAGTTVRVRLHKGRAA